MLVSRWSISFKLIAAFAIVIAVFVAIAALVFFNLGNINRTSILRERSESEITRVDEVSKAMLDMAGLTRGFLLTRDPFFTKGIDKDYGQALDVMGDLGAKADSDDQRASFQAMETAVRGFKSEIVDPQIQLASGPATVDQLVGLMKADAKKKWVAAFRAAEAQFMQREEAIQAARTLDRNRAVAQAQWAIVGGAAFALVVAAALASLLYREIGVPVVAMTAAMKRLASGDLTVIVPAVGRGDEVGQMAGAVRTFKDGAVEKVRLAEEAARIRDVAEAERGRNAAATAEAARELAVVVDALGSALTRLSGGDLTCRVDQAFSADYQRLRMDFNATVEKLQQTMVVIAASSREINAGAENVSQTADNLARRTEQQAAGLEQTAAALDQITATVQRSATGAAKARTVVAEARSDAEHSGKVVRDAVTAMGEIEASSRQISQIIGVIDEIAFQTNLLALNAGVEAARAGDAGRGFAVVASEVRGLAQRAAVAAKEIKQLISASTRQVGAGVSLVSQTGEALRAIIAQVAQIDEVVGQIAASAQEEAVALNQISAAMNQMDQVTQQNAAMVEEATAASHLLDNEANRLNDLIDQFKTASPDISRCPKLTAA